MTTYSGLVTPRPVGVVKARRRGMSLSLRIVGPLALLAIWWLLAATGVLTPTTLSSPQTVARAAGDLWSSGQLPTALGVSLARAGMGLGLGISVGLILGVITGFSTLGEQLFDSSLQLLRAIPFLSLVPLFMVWFGIGNTARVILIAVATAFPMYVSTSGGVRAVDPKLLEAIRTFGVGRLQMIREVVLPSALPSLLSGLRLSMTLSVIALIAAEEINSTSGIGYLMNEAQSYSRTDIMTVCILIYALLGIGADLIARLLERLMMPWKRKR